MSLAASARTRRIGFVVGSALATMSVVGCGPDAVSNDRTQGIELEYRWTNAAEDKRMYFTVDRKGTFGSSGGIKAAMREVNFTVGLSDADIARFVELARATDFAARPSESGATGDLSIVTIRDRGTRHAFEHRGADPALDALRDWCQSVSMRQFRDIIESQPQAGPRQR